MNIYKTNELDEGAHLRSGGLHQSQEKMHKFAFF